MHFSLVHQLTQQLVVTDHIINNNRLIIDKTTSIKKGSNDELEFFY